MDFHVANNQEYIELRNLWCDTFGDDADYVDKFYELLNARGYVVTEDDHVRSCLTMFKAGTFNNQPVWVSYAICTELKYRGNTFARRLTSYVRDLIIDKGGISILCPAETSLVGFYEIVDYKGYFYSDKNIVERDDDISVKASALSSEDYNLYREEFLKDIPHVKLNENMLNFIRWDSSSLQSMLLINGGDAICAIESMEDDVLNVSEIIVNPKLLAYSGEISYQIAQGLATTFDVKKIIFRTTSNLSYVDKVEAMISGDVDEINYNLTMPYFGFPLQ